MKIGLRLSAVRERLRSSLWLWPALSVGVAIVAGALLPMLEGTDGEAGRGFAGAPEGARALLSTVAGSTITVTALIFSLTVVALQVASTQFTPRLMGTFLSDRGNQAVLSVFVGTFVYSLAVLRSIRSPLEAGDAFVPDVAVIVAMVLTVLSVAMLVYFFDHLTQQLRVESVLADVQRDTLALVRNLLAPRDADDGPAPTVPDVGHDALALAALRSGHLQTVDVDRLLQVALDHGVVIHVRPTVGTHVTVGSTVAWGVAVDGGSAPVDVEALTSDLHSGIHLGPERTLQQDVAFGVRQLVDIAARALSPGVNDPTTAVAVLGAAATILVELAGRHMVPVVRTDDDGEVRAVAPMPSFGEILALACDQPRRYGAAEPAVLAELLRMLTDLAEVVADDGDRQAVLEQVRATLEVAEAAELTEAELDRVRSATRHARAALTHGHRIATVTTEAEEPAP